MATCLASTTSLESGGEIWGETGEGHSQGDPEASGCFCVAWHQEVIELDRCLVAVGGMARFGNDYGYAIGPANILFPAITKFAKDIKEKHLLELQVQKTEVFSWTGLLPPEAPPGMKIAGITLDSTLHPGMVVFGIPVGSDPYVQHMLEEVVDEIASQVEQVKDVLAGESQAIWSILHSSLSHKLDCVILVTSGKLQGGWTTFSGPCWRPSPRFPFPERGDRSMPGTASCRRRL